MRKGHAILAESDQVLPHNIHFRPDFDLSRAYDFLESQRNPTIVVTAVGRCLFRDKAGEVHHILPGDINTLAAVDPGDTAETMTNLDEYMKDFRGAPATLPTGCCGFTEREATGTMTMVIRTLKVLTPLMLWQFHLMTDFTLRKKAVYISNIST